MKAITMKEKIAWNMPALTSNSIWGMLSGYLTFYLTQSVLLSTASVGIVLMASKIFDGFTDLIAGYIIEKQTPNGVKAVPFPCLRQWRGYLLFYCFPCPGFLALREN